MKKESQLKKLFIKIQVEQSMQNLMNTKKRLLEAKRENTKIINRIQ